MKYYMNLSTGEVTWSHEDAVCWYRAGDQVAIYRDGKEVLRWEF